MIFFTQVIHRHALKHTRYILQLVVQILLITILILYLFIQLNFDLVSHNFGTKADQFVDSYQLLLLLLISTTLLLGYRLGSLVMGCIRGNTQLFLGLRTLRSRAQRTRVERGERSLLCPPSPTAPPHRMHGHLSYALQ